MHSGYTHGRENRSCLPGNDRLLFGIILGVLAFWLFAQTTLNISPLMAQDLGVQQSLMNIAVSITALFSGIFIVVMGGLADRIGRVKIVQWGFVFSIAGSLLIALAPTGAMGSTFLMLGRICQGFSGAFIMPATRRVPVVDGLVGRVGLRCSVRRPGSRASFPMLGGRIIWPFAKPPFSHSASTC